PSSATRILYKAGETDNATTFFANCTVSPRSCPRLARASTSLSQSKTWMAGTKPGHDAVEMPCRTTQVRVARNSRSEMRDGGGLQTRLEAEEIEEARQVIDLAPAGRRLAAHEVEDLAVLDAVIGEPLDPSILVEVDRDDTLVDGLLHHEGDRSLGALGDVI